MASLEEWLEASLSGEVVSRYQLPSEADLVAIHAQLARASRERRHFRLVEIKEQMHVSDPSD